MVEKIFMFFVVGIWLLAVVGGVIYFLMFIFALLGEVKGFDSLLVIFLTVLFLASAYGMVMKRM